MRTGLPLKTIAAMFALLCAMTVHAAAVEAKPKATKPDAVVLSAADKDALKKLFDQLAQSFLKDDADACLNLFAPRIAARNNLVDNIRDEFLQSHYSRFEILELRMEDAEQDPERKLVFSIDVVMHLEARGKEDGLERRDEKRDYTTMYTFVVQRLPDGTFALRYSEFFKTLGLRGGRGLLLRGMGLVLAFCAVLMFYVWMGWEAWRERPRMRFWRVAVLIPVLGSMLYLLIRLLPRWLRKPKPSATN